MVPGPEGNMEPISPQIFNRLMFCDHVFGCLELEEKLFFTGLDVDFHSEKNPSEENLLDMTFDNFSKMSVFLASEDTKDGKAPTKKEVEKIIDQKLDEWHYDRKRLYADLSALLFAND